MEQLINSDLLNKDTFTIAGKQYRSRLLVGTGNYRDIEETRNVVLASGAEIVTMAIRRTNIGQNPNEPSLLDVISPEEYTYLPNTAGCFSAHEAVRTAKLARELLGGHALIKLEISGDRRILMPNVPETLVAAKELIKDGFTVLVYTNDDPVAAKQLEDIGCAAVMPLAAPIGTGMGILNPHNIRYIVENATVPIFLDAGVGTSSDAAQAMELGCDGVLLNTALSDAKQPVLMAHSMHMAIDAGRTAYLAGRMPMRAYAKSSSPQKGLIDKNSSTTAMIA